jgi:GntR family transcriptional regulator, phosphonate transport system regulatory protein
VTRRSAEPKATLKTRPVSLWRRISDALAAEIKRGAIKGGARLPTDIELAERFECNKHTARRAIGHLEHEGVVRVEWGRGTFVVEGAHGERDATQAKLIHSLLDQHRNLRRKVVRLEAVPATAPVARALRIALGSPCLLLVLLSEAGEAPLSLGCNYFPLKRLPSVANAINHTELTSVAAILAAVGVKAHHRSRIKIGARLPSAEEAMRLRMARQQPLLETESVEVDGRSQPVAYSLMCFRADRLQFVVPS